MFTALRFLAIVLLIVAGVFFGGRLGRLKGRFWFLGFLVPFSAISLVILGHRSTILSFMPPISWAIHPYVGPLLMALAIPLMLTTLLVRLPVKRTRITVGILTAAMLGYYAVLPVALPLLVRKSLASTITKIGKDNVCLQTHSYTCGPAAAVTCLAILHIHAEEGALAIDAESAPAVGTDPVLLAAAINRLTAPGNVRCDYRLIETLDHLTTPAVVSIFSPQYGGHYVAVLQITPGYVLLADPLSGLDQCPRSEFLAQWTGAAHVFTRLR